MLRYLQAFAAAFQLHKYVTFDTEVIRAAPHFPSKHAKGQHQQAQEQQQQQQQHNDGATADHLTNGSGNSNEIGHIQQTLPWPKWQITTLSTYARQSNGTSQSSTHATDHIIDDSEEAYASVTDGHADSAHQAGDDRQTDSQSQTDTYDALVVCNGHYSAPRCPEVSGSEAFPGVVMHSHNYRQNDAFRGQTVVMVGASASGEDICREVAEVADKVLLDTASTF